MSSRNRTSACGGKSLQCPGHMTQALCDAHGTITVVTAEELVSAVAAQRDRHASPRLARQVMCRKRRGIGERLTINRCQLRQIFGEVRSSREGVVIGSEMACDVAGIAAFVVALVVKPDRECVN